MMYETNTTDNDLSEKFPESERLLTELVESIGLEGVRRIVSELESKDSVGWEYLDREQNNLKPIEDASGDVLSALCEVLTNAIDAEIERGTRNHFGLDSTEEFSDTDTPVEDAPDTYKGTVSEYCSEDDIGNVELIGHGGGGDNREDTIHLTVADEGVGVLGSEFESKLLSFNAPGIRKKGWPGAQGQYGCGGHGSIEHCGKRPHTYKLIASASMYDPGTWHWTLIRYSPTSEVNSFEYLTVDGSIPSFEGEWFGREVGTVVTLFDYQIEQKSAVTARLNWSLGSVMVETPFPISVTDRDYFHSEGDKGPLRSSLRTGSDQVADKPELIETDYTETCTFETGDIGDVPIRFVVFKTDDEVKDMYESMGKTRSTAATMKAIRRGYAESRVGKYGRAMMICVNGQTHASFNQRQLADRCDLSKVAKDLVIYVDVSEIGNTALVDLFHGDRASLKYDSDGYTGIGEGFEQELFDSIRNSEKLYEINEERRKQSVKRDTEKMSLDYMKNIVNESDALRSIFSGEDEYGGDEGSGTGGPNTPGPRTDRSGVVLQTQSIPDTLDPLRRVIRHKSPERYEPVPYTDFEWDDKEFEVPADSWTVARFHLNAPNGYLTDIDTADIFETPDPVSKYTLNDGIFRVTITSDAAPGEQFDVPVTIPREGGLSPLESNVSVVVTEPEGEEEQFGLPDVELVNEPCGASGCIEITGSIPAENDGETKDTEIRVYTEFGPFHQLKMNKHWKNDATVDAVEDRYANLLALYCMSAWESKYRRRENQDVDYDRPPRKMAELDGEAIARVLPSVMYSPDELDQLTK